MKTSTIALIRSHQMKGVFTTFDSPLGLVAGNKDKSQDLSAAILKKKLKITKYSGYWSNEYKTKTDKDLRKIPAFQVEPQARKTEMETVAWQAGAKLVGQRTTVEPERDGGMRHSQRTGRSRWEQGID